MARIRHVEQTTDGLGSQDLGCQHTMPPLVTVLPIHTIPCNWSLLRATMPALVYRIMQSSDEPRNSFKPRGIYSVQLREISYQLHKVTEPCPWPLQHDRWYHASYTACYGA